MVSRIIVSFISLSSCWITAHCLRILCWQFGTLFCLLTVWSVAVCMSGSVISVWFSRLVASCVFGSVTSIWCSSSLVSRASWCVPGSSYSLVFNVASVMKYVGPCNLSFVVTCYKDSSLWYNLISLLTVTWVCGSIKPQLLHFRNATIKDVIRRQNEAWQAILDGEI